MVDGYPGWGGGKSQGGQGRVLRFLCGLERGMHEEREGGGVNDGEGRVE